MLNGAPPNTEVQPNLDEGADSEHEPVTLSGEQLLDRLAEIAAAAQASIGPSQQDPLLAKKAKILGEKWHTPPPKKQSGHRQWEFGHKLYALLQLKKANGNKYYVRTKVLPHWELSKSFLNEWVAKEDDRVFVFFQKKKGVTDEKVMVQAFQNWFPANASPVSIVQDAARQHWTALVKAEIASHKLVGTCVPEGLTSYVQWLDCF